MGRVHDFKEKCFFLVHVDWHGVRVHLSVSMMTAHTSVSTPKETGYSFSFSVVRTFATAVVHLQ